MCGDAFAYALRRALGQYVRVERAEVGASSWLSTLREELEGTVMA